MPRVICAQQIGNALKRLASLRADKQGDDHLPSTNVTLFCAGRCISGVSSRLQNSTVDSPWLLSTPSHGSACSEGGILVSYMCSLYLSLSSSPSSALLAPAILFLV